MATAREAAEAEFRRFDTDGDGLLTADEIRQANDALGGQGASESEIEAFIKAADSDGDGSRQAGGVRRPGGPRPPREGLIPSATG
ncbi:EF-hand domain-containing protein [Nonomuraea sp. MTCD27]|uniref:EF-hand domain-containing protein n=1 Tax=Nonomuraea sp. MTCD27 TaxID=1676747 RepID=UPI0035BF5B6B